jgi:hypothetical protein
MITFNSQSLMKFEGDLKLKSRAVEEHVLEKILSDFNQKYFSGNYTKQQGPSNGSELFQGEYSLLFDTRSCDSPKREGIDFC